MADQEVDLDSIIDRLLEVRGSRPGKQVQLLESEIRYLCTKAREIFISQPILLELEAPIKVFSFLASCLLHNVLTKLRFAVISMANTTIFCASLNTVAFRQKPTTFSSETTLTVASSPSKPSAFSSHTRSSTPKISSSSVGTTSAHPSTESMVSMMNANGGTTSSSGRHSPIASTACLLPPSSMRRSLPCTVV